MSIDQILSHIGPVGQKHFLNRTERLELGHALSTHSNSSEATFLAEISEINRQNITILPILRLYSLGPMIQTMPLSTADFDHSHANESGLGFAQRAFARKPERFALLAKQNFNVILWSVTGVVKYQLPTVSDHVKTNTSIPTVPIDITLPTLIIYCNKFARLYPIVDAHGRYLHVLGPECKNISASSFLLLKLIQQTKIPG
jgi:hypothetical protein